MTKISIYVPYMTGYGGTETVIKNLFNEYNHSETSNFFNLIEIGGYKDSNWLDDIQDKKIIWFSKYKLLRTLEYLLFLPFILARETKRQNSDIVISTNPIIWTILYFFKQIGQRDYQVVSWYHYSLSIKSVKRFFLLKADVYLAISSGIAQQLIASGVDKEKIKLVYNPVMKRTLNVYRTVAPETIRFIYVGRLMLNGQKNLKELLDALSLVIGKWHLDIYGTGDEQKITQYISKKKLCNNVTFKGFVSDAWSDMKVADATILTSTYEGFPMVLNESLSVGIPVVSSNCPTGPDDIIDMKNGLLYQMGNTQELAAILQKIIDREISFDNNKSLKKSIKKFYSDSYFQNFMKVLEI